MSDDLRLRDVLERTAREVDDAAEVEQLLSRVALHVRRRRKKRRVGASLGLAALAAVGFAFFPRGAERLDANLPAATVPPAPSVASLPAALVGTYTKVVEAGRPAERYGVKGRWRITVRPGGVLDVIAPSRFSRTVSVPVPTTLTVTGDQLTLTALGHDAFGCSEPGVYRWGQQGKVLRLTTIDDQCPYRPAVMSNATWKKI